MGGIIASKQSNRNIAFRPLWGLASCWASSIAAVLSHGSEATMAHRCSSSSIATAEPEAEPDANSYAVDLAAAAKLLGHCTRSVASELA